MESHRRLYYYLFNRISDAITALKENDGDTALKILIRAQQKSEEMFIEETLSE